MPKFAFAVLLASAGIVPAQDTPRTKPKNPHGRVPYDVRHNASDREFDGDTTERRIEVDPKLNLSLCAVSGRLLVNGSDQNELRVLVRDGSAFSFSVKESNTATEKPLWITLNSADEKFSGFGSPGCIWGDSIEIDLPRNASVSVKGRDLSAVIDSVRKAAFDSIGGDITFRNIANGISASTGRGDINVETARGPIKVNSTTGSILLFDVGPSASGDALKANTSSGTITMQDVLYKQVDANSISGSIRYTGSAVRDAAYNFFTTIGQVRLNLPADTSSSVVVSHGRGDFRSDLPFKTETDDLTGTPNGPVKMIKGVLGSGGSTTFRLSSTNGSIVIQKL